MNGGRPIVWLRELFKVLFSSACKIGSAKCCGMFHFQRKHFYHERARRLSGKNFFHHQTFLLELFHFPEFRASSLWNHGVVMNVKVTLDEQQFSLEQMFKHETCWRQWIDVNKFACDAEIAALNFWTFDGKIFPCISIERKIENNCIDFSNDIRFHSVKSKSYSKKSNESF